MSGAAPPPSARPLERAARVPRPVCSECGRWGCGDLAPAPQRAPLRAGVARCGGAEGRPRGGAFHHCEGRLRSGAVPPPTARPLAVGVRHPRAVGASVWVWGPNTVPLACMPCGGCVPRGWWGAVPGGGWPATVVRGVWCQALSLPRPPVLWSRRPGFRDPCVPGAVGAGVGTQHRPHIVRPCGPALLMWGWRKGVPGGGAFHHCEGRLRSGAVPPQTARPPAVGVRHPRAVGAGVWVWGPNTVPLACMPCGGCVPRGWWGAVPGGGWPATVVRGTWCQALSLLLPPVLWSGQPGFRDLCVPGAVGAGVGTQHRPHSVRPCGPALLAVGVAEGRPRRGRLPPL